MMWLIVAKKNGQSVLIQNMVTFKSSREAACLKFNCCHVTCCFPKHPLWAKQYNFHQMKEVYISQGSATTFSDMVDKFIIMHVKFLKDSAHQDLLKSLHFWMSCSKTKRGSFFKYSVRVWHTHTWVHIFGTRKPRKGAAVIAASMHGFASCRKLKSPVTLTLTWIGSRSYQHTQYM